MDTKQLRGQLESLWFTRPVRGPERTIAGVCHGIGARYRVDPTLVKVAFVVAAFFGGSGLVLYLAAWIAFPGTAAANRAALGGHPVHINPRRMMRSPRFILFVILAIVLLTSFGPNRTWGSGGLVGAILMLVGWYLLYLRTPTPPEGTSVAPSEAADPAVREPAGVTLTKSDSTADPATEALDVEPPVPPAWDPLGTAQFAWDLPEPGPAGVDDERPPRSRLTLIVVGLAIIAAAAATGAHQAGVEWFTVGRILSLTLAVVGAGLLIGALRARRSHGAALVPIAIALAAAVVVSTALAGGLGDLAPSGGVGERDWKPLTENDIKDSYQVGMGSITLDLRNIDLTTDRHIEVRAGLGEISIKVPENMNVRADCSVSVGDYSCPDGLDGGRDGTAGPVLTIDAHAGMGNVEVVR